VPPVLTAEMTEQDPSTLVHMDTVEIMERIPHRYPFLLVDRITAIKPGKWIKGYKNVSFNEPFFEGHFPGKPLMPGVLIIEAIAQVGAILISGIPQAQGKIIVFAGIDKCRFKRQVGPGDRLEMFGEITKLRDSIGKSTCYAHVDGELVAECELMFSFIPDDRLAENK
jgi:3-hydroxyacyl-[acyl-carrier-protein] dehydratase